MRIRGNTRAYLSLSLSRLSKASYPTPLRQQTAAKSPLPGTREPVHLVDRRCAAAKARIHAQEGENEKEVILQPLARLRRCCIDSKFRPEKVADG